MSKAFQPLQVGRLQVAHRLALAPMTRCRATENHVPTHLMGEYYHQRSAYPGTLVIAEATPVSKVAGGQANVPAIWSDEQIAGWKNIIDIVHANKSHFVSQLWALGRVANAQVAEKEGFDVVGPAAVPVDDKATVPRALTEREIEQYVQDFAQAARNAVKAGADAVEIHGAHGYLINQFLNPLSNIRTDKYGGSVENRARFLLQIVDAVSDAVGADRTAVRLSPWNDANGMAHPVSPLAQYTYVVEQLEKRAMEGNRLAYLHIFDPPRATGRDCKFVRDVWTGVMIRCADFHDRAYREAELANDDQLITAVGRYFMANPDFVKRVEQDLPLNEPDYTTLYTSGKAGYTDYPISV